MRSLAVWACSLLLLGSCSTQSHKGVVRIKQTMVCENAKKCELSQESIREGDIPALSVTP